MTEYHLYQTRPDEWVVADQAGWLPGVYNTPDAALNAALNAARNAGGQ